MVTSSFDQTSIIWDTTTGGVMRVLKGHTDFVISAVFSKDGSQVVTASEDRTARTWDAKSGTVLLVLKGHTDNVTFAEFN
mmetsp:Transcript_7373/g.6451  ORF Transcript_7373/g.6451 Transcript_7373/m.6451 type:complete len:80 (-) Transcript_7373:184-423(-)